MKRRTGRKGKRCQASGGKVSYRDESSARKVKNYLRDGHYHGKRPERVYRCGECGGWHLTSTSETSGLYAERQQGKKER